MQYFCVDLCKIVLYTPDMETVSRKTVALPEDLHLSLIVIAEERGMKLRVLIERALRAFVAKTKKAA